MYRTSKCRISLGLVACSCVPRGHGTLSPEIVATQCKQFCTKTLTSFDIVVHATYSLIAPSAASTLCVLQSGSVFSRTSVAAARLHARESIVHCSSSLCRQHRLAAAVLHDEPSRWFAGNARTYRQRSAAPVESPSSTETLPYRSRAR
jgi:hypothetical protein